MSAARKPKGNRRKGGGVLQEMKKEERVDVHRFPMPIIVVMNYPVVIRYRFITGSAVSPMVTRKMLLDIFVQGNTTTTYSRVWAAVKLRKVEVWGGAQSTTTTTNVIPYSSVSLEWLSSYGPAVVKSDSGNFERPAHIECRPPRRSLAGFWSLVGQNEADVLFKFSGSLTGVGLGPLTGIPAATIVDLHLQVTNLDDEGVTVYSAITGAVAGQNYVRDFTTAPGSSSPNFSPEGYTAIA